MLSFVPAAMTDAFAGGFGAAAAIVLIGGAVLLRWQRNRLQFGLMQAAIEHGVAPLAGGPPLWLVSLRQGVMILVLGIGLVIAGWFACSAADRVEMPTIVAATRPVSGQPLGGAMQRDFPRLPQQRFDGEGPMDRPDGPNGPPPFNERRPGPPLRDMNGARGEGPRNDGVRGEGPPPGRPNPALEKWHRAQDQKAVATVAMGSGLVLSLLGIVRVIFAFAERRYAPIPSPGTPGEG